MQLLGFKPLSWLKNIYYYKEAKFIYPKEEMLKGKAAPLVFQEALIYFILSPCLMKLQTVQVD